MDNRDRQELMRTLHMRRKAEIEILSSATVFGGAGASDISSFARLSHFLREVAVASFSLRKWFMKLTRVSDGRAEHPLLAYVSARLTAVLHVEEGATS